MRSLEELETAGDELGLGPQELRAVTEHETAASFLDEDTKTRAPQTLPLAAERMSPRGRVARPVEVVRSRLRRQ